MTVVQILDASFRLYRENFFLFLGIMAVPYVPALVLSVIVNTAAMSVVPEGRVSERHPFSRDVDSALQESGGPTIQDSGCALAAIIAASVFTMLIFLIAVPIARGALTRAVSDRYLGRAVSFGESYRAVMSIFWRFIGTTMLVGLVIGLGFILCIVPGIILFTWFAFVSQIMIIEGIAGTRSMGRSKDLSAGHRWRILGLIVLTIVVNYALSIAASFVFGSILPLLIDSPTILLLVNSAWGYLITMMIEPLWAVAYILLYYDVRIRKEAFDLQLLATRVS